MIQEEQDTVEATQPEVEEQESQEEVPETEEGAEGVEGGEKVKGKSKAKKRRTIKDAKNGRLFLTNLVYDTNKRMLTKLLKQYGEIEEINIPMNPANNKPRGFAFVQMKRKNSALKAIRALNGKKWKGRELGIKLSLDKRQYEGKNKTGAKEGEEPEMEGAQFDDSIQVVKATKLREQKEKEDKQKTDGEEGGEEEGLKDGEELAEEDYDELDNIVMNNLQNMDEEFEFEEENEKEIDLNEEEDSGDEDEDKSSDDEDKKEGEEGSKHKKSKYNVDEDLSRTVFIRNIPFDVKEPEFRKYCSRMGTFYYAKLVKQPTDPKKHNGNGFVKFQDIDVALKLISLSREIDSGNYIPSGEDFDLYIKGSRPHFFPAIDKRKAKTILLDRSKELKDKNDGVGQKADHKKRHRKTANLETLLKEDKFGKRRLKYSVLGFNILEEEDKKKASPFDVKQRQDHQIEKLTKMQNPNFYVSETRVLLKNIDKMLSEKIVREQIVKICTEKVEGGEKYKNKKIIKDIKLLEFQDDRSSNFANRGLGFIEFAIPEVAESFVRYIDTPQKAHMFNERRLPIVEFAFEDARKVRKIKGVSAKNKNWKQGEAAQGQRSSAGMGKTGSKNDDVAPELTQVNKAELQKQKKAQKNRNSIIMLRAQELKSDADSLSVTEMKKMLNESSGRGFKQRIKKLFVKYSPKFNESRKEAIAQQEKKSQLKKRVPKREDFKKQRKGGDTLRTVQDDPLHELTRGPKGVKNVKIKKNKKEKTRDFGDDLAEAYLQKKRSKLNWTKNTD